MALARPHCTQDKSKLSEDHLPGLAEIVGEEDVAKAVLKVPPLSSALSNPYLAPKPSPYLLDTYVLKVPQKQPLSMHTPKYPPCVALGPEGWVWEGGGDAPSFLSPRPTHAFPCFFPADVHHPRRGHVSPPAAVSQAARSSMGMDTSEQDMNNIVIFTDRMISLALYRKQVRAQ